VLGTSRRRDATVGGHCCVQGTQRRQRRSNHPGHHHLSERPGAERCRRAPVCHTAASCAYRAACGSYVPSVSVRPHSF
jgi:hypothetical protein